MDPYLCCNPENCLRVSTHYFSEKILENLTHAKSVCEGLFACTQRDQLAPSQEGGSGSFHSPGGGGSKLFTTGSEGGGVVSLRSKGGGAPNLRPNILHHYSETPLGLKPRFAQNQKTFYKITQSDTYHFFFLCFEGIMQ